MPLIVLLFAHRILLYAISLVINKIRWNRQAHKQRHTTHKQCCAPLFYRFLLHSANLAYTPLDQNPKRNHGEAGDIDTDAVIIANACRHKDSDERRCAALHRNQRHKAVAQSAQMQHFVFFLVIILEQRQYRINKSNPGNHAQHREIAAVKVHHHRKSLIQPLPDCIDHGQNQVSNVQCPHLHG